MGVTDVYEEGKFRYWSSGKEVDFNGAAWTNGNLDGGSDFDCAVVVGLHDLLDNQPCDSAHYYGLCELDADIC